MRSEPVIAVVGTSTLVGRELIEILLQGGISYSTLRCLDSAGAEMEVVDSL